MREISNVNLKNVMTTHAKVGMQGIHVLKILIVLPITIVAQKILKALIGVFVHLQRRLVKHVLMIINA